MIKTVEDYECVRSIESDLGEIKLIDVVECEIIGDTASRLIYALGDKKIDLKVSKSLSNEDVLEMKPLIEDEIIKTFKRLKEGKE